LPSEEQSWPDVFDASAELGFDDCASPAPPRGDGPMRVCLACGEAPSSRECPHDEVATLETPATAVRAAAAQLARATQERRAAERALRRLVESELLRGRASVEREAAPPPQPPPSAPVAAAPAEQPVTRPRARRGVVVSEQGFFAFAAPAPTAQEPSTLREELAPQPVKARRRRARGAAPEADAAVEETG
jgi:hypothetical protein